MVKPQTKGFFLTQIEVGSHALHMTKDHRGLCNLATYVINALNFFSCTTLLICNIYPTEKMNNILTLNKTFSPISNFKAERLCSVYSKKLLIQLALLAK